MSRRSRWSNRHGRDRVRLCAAIGIAVAALSGGTTGAAAEPDAPGGIENVKPAVSAAPSDRPSPGAEEFAQGQRLVEQGERYLDQGNIAIARGYFARAAELGLAIGAVRMAETYDPAELAKRSVHGVKADPAEAERWYRRAFGTPQAEATGSSR